MRDIIVVCQGIPFPPDTGGKIKTYHLITFLLGLHFRLTVISVITAQGRQDVERGSEHLCGLGVTLWTVNCSRSVLSEVGALARGVLRRESIMLARDNRQRVAKVIRRAILGASDPVVWCVRPQMAQYLLDPGLAGVLRNQGGLAVFDTENVEAEVCRATALCSKGLWKWLWDREATTIAKAEAAMTRAFDWTVTVSDEDLEQFRIWGARNTVVSRVGVSIPPRVLSTVGGSRPQRALFVASFRWMPNIDGALYLVREIWPKVVARLPKAELHIVGAHPPRHVAREAAKSGAVLCGYVSNLDEAYAHAKVALAPLRFGGGVRVKVIEALAYGLPVIGTPSARLGLTVDLQPRVRVCTDADEFAAAIVEELTTGGPSADTRMWGERVQQLHHPAVALASLKRILG